LDFKQLPDQRFFNPSNQLSAQISSNRLTTLFSGLISFNKLFALSLSYTLPAVTTTLKSKPKISTNVLLFLPITFLSASKPCSELSFEALAD
jgi:hypothetical protein